jgi:hypothetical protein
VQPVLACIREQLRLRNGNTGGQKSLRGNGPLLLVNAVFQRNYSQTRKHTILYIYLLIFVVYLMKLSVKVKGKAVPLYAWSGPEVSRKLWFPVYMTTAQDGGKVVSLTHRSLLPPRNAPGTHFC